MSSSVLLSRLLIQTILCTNAQTGAPFATIVPSPQTQTAQVYFAKGSPATVKYVTSVEKTQRGCFNSAHVKQMFWHPYYELDVTSVLNWGEYRCAGESSSSIVSAFFRGESQTPKSLNCTYLKN